MALAVDGQGNAAVTGYTNSTNFLTTTTALQGAHRGGDDAFVSVLDGAGTRLIMSTHLGGEADEQGWAVALDGSTAAYVTGSTASPDFPVASGVQASKGSGSDGFVAKLTLPRVAFSSSTASVG